MIAEIGQFSLSLALAFSLVLAIVPMLGAARNDARLMALARPAASGMFLFTLIAFGCLMAGFLQNDFSIALVATHSNSALPLPYRIAATWGSHEGSILLWALMLAGWSCAVAAFSSSLSDVLRARILAVMGILAVGFLLFTLLTSNPFERLVPAAADGRDLNPLLQDPGMVFHPPLLYMGYVGLAVAFSFAVAGMIAGRFDAAWARWTRPWTLVAWSFLSLGIALGSFWAYYELGWGGWWFWDPVENASFMPWLVATALIHSLSVTEKRGTFRSWTVLLAILAFSLSLLGTFLVRSGVLTSVHAFATDPARGVFILGFLALVIGGSLTLFAWRAPTIGAGNRFGAVSRESFLLANNILLVVATAAVLLGTLYPLVLDALNLGKISVGPPYFDSVFYPLMAPALFLMALGPVARWKNAELPEMAHRFKWVLAVAVIAAFVAPLVASLAGHHELAMRPLVSLGLAFAFWVAGAVLVSAFDLVRTRDGKLSVGSMAGRARRHPASVWGMHIAHIGIAVFVLGVTLVKSYEIEGEHRVTVGDTFSAGSYSLRFTGTEEIRGPNYTGTRGTFLLFEGAKPAEGAKPIATLLPEKRTYLAGGMPMTEAAIDRSLIRDVYIAMGEPVDGGAWVIRAQVKPFINWIWIGWVLMALGGFSAAADKRYRRAREERRSAAAAAAEPARG